MAARRNVPIALEGKLIVTALIAIIGSADLFGRRCIRNCSRVWGNSYFSILQKFGEKDRRSHAILTCFIIFCSVSECKMALYVLCLIYSMDDPS